MTHPTLACAPRGRYFLPLVLVLLGLAGWLGEPAAPRIERLCVRAESTRAVVTWTTREPADTALGFAGPGVCGRSVSRAQSATREHRIVLCGLTPGSTYRFTVDARDAWGRAASRTSAFRTYPSLSGRASPMSPSLR